jgi:hypothetical protein
VRVSTSRIVGSNRTTAGQPQRGMPMMQALAWMTSVNWSKITTTLALVATAVIAFMALRNWQRQDKAKREAEFLDALVEAAHAYISDLPAPW